MSLFKREIRIYGFEGKFCKDCPFQMQKRIGCILYGYCEHASFAKQIRNPLCIQEEKDWNKK